MTTVRGETQPKINIDRLPRTPYGFTDLAAYLGYFSGRVLADALVEVTPDYWRRRAATWEAAAPRPDDFHGQATDGDLSAAWRRCMDTAAACRRHADLLAARPVDLVVLAEVDTVLNEVA